MADFLTCSWKKLAMINYAIDPALLLPHLPAKTELDVYNNTCLVSLVGFMFHDTKAFGIPLPFHTTFEEVNLRFYVRHRNANGVWKRGVVFLKEIVPKSLLAFFANQLYHEHYVTLPMQHRWTVEQEMLIVEYRWKNLHWNFLRTESSNVPTKIKPGSEEEFIFEHYWGYTRVDKRTTYEYEVVHPVWEVYPVKAYQVQVDFGALYGKEFAFLDQEKPQSVFLAEGSDVIIRSKRKLKVC